MASLNFAERELATLRAALRCWINELGYYDIDELLQHYPELGPEPLSMDEADALLMRVARESGEAGR